MQLIWNLTIYIIYWQLFYCLENLYPQIIIQDHYFFPHSIYKIDFFLNILKKKKKKKKRAAK